jgi:hypothetical protein
VKATAPGLIEAHWRQVEKGMTRQQVENLLGDPQRTFPVGRVVEGLKQGFQDSTETISLWSGADTPFPSASSCVYLRFECIVGLRQASLTLFRCATASAYLSRLFLSFALV